MTLKVFKNSILKKIIFILGLLVLGLFFLIPQNLYSEETGFKYFRNYTYVEYDHYPQNWGMAQAKDGIIYVANQAGVLIYDGAYWRVLGIPDYTTVRSLAIDDIGTVFIGGDGEIGYLAPNEKGFLRYVSLMDRLQDDQRDFSPVWRTHATGEGIYFGSYEFLFRWNPKHKEMKVWECEPDHRFLYSFVINGRFFIHQENVGLMEMVNDSLKLVPGGEIFADSQERIFMIVPYDTDKDNQRLLVGTRSKGFYLYDEKTMKPFPTELAGYLKKKIAYHGTRLSSGDFAMATRYGGLIIMDSNGRQRYIYDKKSGLQDDNVKYVFQDSQGNLWLCLEKGISKIEYVSPISIHDERSGLPGLVMSVVRHNNDLYVGTTKGLYSFESTFKFRLAAGMSISCWSLLPVEDSILAATSSGVFQVDNKNNTKRKVITDISHVLLRSGHHPARTWCGTRDRLVALAKENGRWIEEHRFENINHEIWSIVEDKDGNVWLGTKKEGALKVEFSGDIKHPVVRRYDKSHELPDGEIYVARAAGHVIFATANGIFRYDKKKEKFVADLTLGDKFAG
ncbi:MAG: hypothetical protein JSV88_09755, partial [Candidatus Aminicenantes bacterium]